MDASNVTVLYEVDVVNGFAGFEAIEREWSELLSDCEANHPFNTHRWFATWWRNFGKNSRVSVLVARFRGRLVCCLPLLIAEKNVHPFKARHLSLWVNTHSFRSGILCHKDHLACLDEVLNRLISDPAWDILDLGYFPAHHEVLRAWKRAMEKAGIRYLTKPGMKSPRLVIRATWKEYFTSLSKSRRESVSRKLRKAKKQGCRVEILRGRTGDLDTRLEQCWEISRKTWKHQIGSSIAADEARLAFYRDIALAEVDWIVLGLIYVNDKPVAFEYDLLYQGVLYNLKLGFDEATRELSPGYVLRVALLEWAFDNGIEVFDFMGLEADYKNQFSTGVVDHENITVYNKGALPASLYYYQANLDLYRTRIKPPFQRIRGWLQSVS